MSTLAEPAGLGAIAEEVQQQAAEWLTVLMSDEASEAEHAAWQRWRGADPEHERAWQHIDAVSRRFNGLHRSAAAQALAGTQQQAVNGKRRQLLAWLGVAAGGGMLAAQTGTWDGVRALRADYRTATGERREVVLDDGSVLSLNTGSAVNVRFDDKRRLIELLAGEILVSSGHGAGSAAPLVVATREGLVRALGTRFVVRQQDGVSTVEVFESAVEIRPRDSAGAPLLLAAGRGVAFSRHAPDAPHAIDAYADAWSRGRISTALSNTSTVLTPSCWRTTKRVPSARTRPSRVATTNGAVLPAPWPLVTRISPASSSIRRRLSSKRTFTADPVFRLSTLPSSSTTSRRSPVAVR